MANFWPVMAEVVVVKLECSILDLGTSTGAAKYIYLGIFHVEGVILDRGTGRDFRSRTLFARTLDAGSLVTNLRCT